MALLPQQMMMQNINGKCAFSPNYTNDINNYYEECKNGIGCKSFKYGNCIYHHGQYKTMDITKEFNNNVNKNKEEVKEIIKSINENFKQSIKLSNGSLSIHEEQLKINNMNMKDINQKLKQLQTHDLIKNSLGTFEKALINTLNTKLDNMSKYLIKNQLNTQNELKELRKEHNNITLKINNNDKKLSNICKQINDDKRNKNNNIQETNSSNTILEQKVKELQIKNINLSSKIDKKLNDMIKKLSGKNNNNNKKININKIEKLLLKYDNNNQIKTNKKIDDAVIKLQSNIKEECKKLELEYKKYIENTKTKEIKYDKSSNKLKLTYDYNILDNGYNNYKKCITVTINKSNKNNNFKKSAIVKKHSDKTELKFDNNKKVDDIKLNDYSYEKPQPDLPQLKTEPPGNLCNKFPECHYGKNCKFYHPFAGELSLWHKKYNIYKKKKEFINYNYYN